MENDIDDSKARALAAALAPIAKLIGKEDNAYTADPIFLVQERVLESGYDPDFGGDVAWFHSEGEVVFRKEAPERFARFEAEDFSGEDDGDQDDWTRTGYQYRWEFVQPFLTRAAADLYCKTQHHRHRGKLRVYVESAYRNWEWQLVREALEEFAK